MSKKPHEQSISTCAPLEREFYSLHKLLKSASRDLNCLKVTPLRKHVNIF